MYGKMQESELIEIIPLICTSATWDQYPAFLHPESSQGAQSGVAAVASGLRLDGCNILFLLIWQPTFLVRRLNV